jgi:hypothetical protein
MDRSTIVYRKDDITMLHITADIFSGRPNPDWIITDENEVRAILKEMARNREMLTDTPPVDAGLGFRGVIVEPLSDDLAKDFDLQASTYIALGATAAGAHGAELAERLIGMIPTATRSAETVEGEIPLDEALQSFLMEELVQSGRTSAMDGPGLEASAQVVEELARATCYYDTSPYNPKFWNDNATIRARNNCYNYASNKRTDTFAQPGRGCGHMYTSITCAEVTRAALCDGLHRRYNCFPDSEYPRYLVALVVAPGPRFIDFHWYRLMREGFWGHKPGGTAVTNKDNCGKVITNPQTCCRGYYTQFCGYFYTCRSQKIK